MMPMRRRLLPILAGATVCGILIGVVHLSAAEDTDARRDARRQMSGTRSFLPTGGDPLTAGVTALLTTQTTLVLDPLEGSRRKLITADSRPRSILPNRLKLPPLAEQRRRTGDIIEAAFDSLGVRHDPKLGDLRTYFKPTEIDRAEGMIEQWEKAGVQPEVCTALRIVADIQRGRGAKHAEALAGDFRDDLLIPLRLAAVPLLLAQVEQSGNNLHRRIHLLMQARRVVTSWLEDSRRRLSERARRSINLALYLQILAPAAELENRIVRADQPERAAQLAELLYLFAYYKFNVFSQSEAEYPEVERHLTNALRLTKPDSPLTFATHYFRGVVRLWLRDPLKVREDLAAMRAIRPDDPWAHLLSAETARLNRDTQTAEAEYQAAIRHARRNPMFAQRSLAQVMRRYAVTLIRKNTEASLVTALSLAEEMKALPGTAIDGNRVEGIACEDLAWRYGRRELFARGIAAFTTAVQAADADDLASRGWYLMDLGRCGYRAAEFADPKQLRMDYLPDALHALTQAANLLLRVVRDPELDAKERLAWSAYLDQAQFYRGLVLHHLGRFDEARAAFASIRGADDAGIFRTLGRREMIWGLLDQATSAQAAGRSDDANRLLAEARKEIDAGGLSPIARTLLTWRTAHARNTATAFTTEAMLPNWPYDAFRANHPQGIDENALLICMYYDAFLDWLKDAPTAETRPALQEGVKLVGYYVEAGERAPGSFPFRTRSRIQNTLKRLNDALTTSQTEKKAAP